METDEAVLITVFDLSDTLFVNKQGGVVESGMDTSVTKGEYLSEHVDKKKAYFLLIFFPYYCFLLGRVFTAMPDI
jgi:hypothetical protein